MQCIGRGTHTSMPCASVYNNIIIMCMIIITHQVEYTYNDTIYNDILCYCTVTVMLMVVVQC